MQLQIAIIKEELKIFGQKKENEMATAITKASLQIGFSTGRGFLYRFQRFVIDLFPIEARIYNL